MHNSWEGQELSVICMFLFCIFHLYILVTWQDLGLQSFLLQYPLWIVTNHLLIPLIQNECDNTFFFTWNHGILVRILWRANVMMNIKQLVQNLGSYHCKSLNFQVMSLNFISETNGREKKWQFLLYIWEKQYIT